MKDSGTAPNCTPGVSSSCSVVLLPQQSPYYFKVRNPLFCVQFLLYTTPVIKTMFLPRQARDKHRNSSSRTKGVFLQVGDNPLQLYAIYPAEQIGISSDNEVQKVAANTVEVLAAWQQQNAFPVVFPAAVRAGVNWTLTTSELTTRIGGELPPNGYLNQGGGGIETAGGLLAVTEMLLQSWDGVLRLFPVWSGEDASFRNLRAVGAFLVSATLADGKVTEFTIESEAGALCSFASPFAVSHPPCAHTRNSEPSAGLRSQKPSIRFHAFSCDRTCLLLQHRSPRSQPSRVVGQRSSSRMVRRQGNGRSRPSLAGATR